MHLTKKLSHSLRSLGRIHAGRLRHYAPHACAPYLKVISQIKAMKIFFFIIGVALYLAALNLLVKGHKSLNLRFGWPTPSGLANNALCYFFFAAFICVVIPFAFFFPLWLNTFLPVLQSTQTNNALLILLGGFVLSVTMWLNYKKSKQGSFNSGL
ncbi:hypothetical protein MADE_1003255 [Alteromonas mediterranea DE]|uniref:Uncharacterized protein n=3 Tax=Alteromonas mediterranea TaxID=314275 RepID=F2G898_ALTMD|nr:hypothetical protein MADE_1003255 [Alteromonas mediterranea DE]CAH1216755.1 hypothetical protein ISS312_04117 [Alteromonas mediterranea]|tara:strand:- start:1282 stop:1746 length:465 start_codon:yes stop_codon:yes gene_type:complete